jgi:hypothetical protein
MRWPAFASAQYTTDRSARLRISAAESFVADGLHSEPVEHRLRDGADGDAHRRAAGTRALGHGRNLVEAVLHDTGEVRVTGAKHRRESAARLSPYRARAIWQHDRDGRAGGLSLPQSADQRDLVLLDLLAAAAPVRLAPARELALNDALVELQSRRQPFHDADQRFAVRISRGEKSNRHQLTRRPGERSVFENSSTASAISLTSKPWSVQMRRLSAACETNKPSPPSVRAPAWRAVSRNKVCRGL